jgi:hypothetical protein
MMPIIEVCNTSRDASTWAAIAVGAHGQPPIARINGGRGSGAWPSIGVVIGLWWHPLGVAAAARMALLLAGAVITHRRAADGGKEMAPALAALALTIAYLVIALGA